MGLLNDLTLKAKTRESRHISAKIIDRALSKSPVIFQKPTKDEWVNIKKDVNRSIASSAHFMKPFNYPEGVKVKRPKKDINKIVRVLKRAKAGESNFNIEFKEYYDENAEMSNKVIARNKEKIKSIKRYYNAVD